MNNTPVGAAQLAAEFSHQLADSMASHELQQVRIRNAAESDPAICHSHDFCDANQVMLDSFESLAGREADVGSAADRAVMDAAWTIARACGFGADRALQRT